MHTGLQYIMVTMTLLHGWRKDTTLFQVCDGAMLIYFVYKKCRTCQCVSLHLCLLVLQVLYCKRKRLSV